MVTCGVAPFFVLLSAALQLLSKHGILVTPGSAGVVLAYVSILSFKLPTVVLLTSFVERILSGAPRAPDPPPLALADTP